MKACTMPWHPWLREQLVDSLRSVPPNAPTLCEGWQARHLAAHLVLREHAPWRLLGGGLDTLADEARDDAAYRDLIDRVSQPPQAWSPHSWAGDAMNVAEFYVHSEDVRRGGGVEPAPRDLPPDLVEALRGALTTFARLRLGRCPVGVTLVDDEGRRLVVSDREPVVEIHGPVTELVLHVFGRVEAADTEVRGREDAVAQVAQVLGGPDA
ncbi:TIGR03085 family protein [Paraoerskovia marina]|uniref:TIGR03085 family protein n=2 Tax=Paraoerskovia marina TaxID=545619 RepID=A0A1H1T8H2_9CELL|nr:TIGR03085 family protein [Paraoerskovia marina]